MLLVGGRPGAALCRVRKQLCVLQSGKVTGTVGRQNVGGAHWDLYAAERSNGVDVPIVPWMDLKTILSEENTKRNV